MIRLVEIVNWLGESEASELAKQIGLFSRGFGRYSTTKDGPITHTTEDGQLVDMATRKSVGKSSGSKPKNPARTDGKPVGKRGAKNKPKKSSNKTNKKPLPLEDMESVIESYPKLREEGKKNFKNMYRLLSTLGDKMAKGKKLNEAESKSVQKLVRKNLMVFDENYGGFRAEILNGGNRYSVLLSGTSPKGGTSGRKKLLGYLRKNGIGIASLRPDQFSHTNLFNSFQNTSGDPNFGKLIPASSAIKVDKTGTISFKSATYSRIDDVEGWSNGKLEEWIMENPNADNSKKKSVRKTLEIIATITNRRHQMLREISEAKGDINIATFDSESRPKYEGSLKKSIDFYMKGCNSGVSEAGYTDSNTVLYTEKNKRGKVTKVITVKDLLIDTTFVAERWDNVKNNKSIDSVIKSLSEILNHLSEKQKYRRDYGSIPENDNEKSKLSEAFTTLVELSRSDRKCIIPVVKSWENWDVASLRGSTLNPGKEKSVSKILNTYKFIKVDTSGLDLGTESIDSSISVKDNKGAGNDPAHKTDVNRGWIYKGDGDADFIKQSTKMFLGKKQTVTARVKTKKGKYQNRDVMAITPDTLSIFSPLKTKRKEYKRKFEESLKPYVNDIVEYYKLPPNVDTPDKVMRFLQNGKPGYDKDTGYAIPGKGIGGRKDNVPNLKKLAKKSWGFDDDVDIDDTLRYAHAQHSIIMAVFNRRTLIQPDAIHSWTKDGLVEADGVKNLAKMSSITVNFGSSQKGFKTVARVDKNGKVSDGYIISPFPDYATTSATTSREELMFGNRVKNDVDTTKKKDTPQAKKPTTPKPTVSAKPNPKPVEAPPLPNDENIRKQAIRRLNTFGLTNPTDAQIAGAMDTIKRELKKSSRSNR